MPANTIRRVRLNPPTTIPPDVTLRFTSGLVVHPADCPRGISAHGHWRAGVNGRAVCKCDKENTK